MFVCLWSLLERMLECAVTDIHEAPVAPGQTETAEHLLMVVQDFLQAEGLVNPALWSLRLLEGALSLMDALMVWYSTDAQGRHLAQLGLRLLLGFIAQPHPQVREGEGPGARGGVSCSHRSLCVM